METVLNTPGNLNIFEYVKPKIHSNLQAQVLLIQSYLFHFNCYFNFTNSAWSVPPCHETTGNTKAW